MSMAVVEGGTFYHREAILGGRLSERFDEVFYLPELEEGQLDRHAVVMVADRINASMLRRQRRLLLSYMAQGGTLVVYGENRIQEWLPGVDWSFRATNFWWWREGQEPGHRIVAPKHEIFRFMAHEATIWHFHGLLQPPPGAGSIVDIAADFDPLGQGGSILYDHPGVMQGKGRLILTTLDPFFHHGSFFMPASSRFLDG